MELIDAIRAAQSMAPGFVCWNKAKGWHAVRPIDYRAGLDLDFICAGFGHHPLPMTETALEAWASLINERIGQWATQ